MENEWLKLSSAPIKSIKKENVFSFFDEICWIEREPGQRRKLTFFIALAFEKVRFSTFNN